MARAPQAISMLWNSVHVHIPRAKLGGIVGDVHHSFGYHLARNELPRSDYSVQLGPDRLGASDCASALDVTLPADLMITCTKRLLAAAKAHDPRLHAVREFCGTIDGRNTYPWDVYSGDRSEGVNTWDDSHLWHIHLSFLRQYADNAAALAPVALVLAGLGAAPVPPPPPSGPHLRRAWPAYMPANHYFGLITGPNASHGGYNLSERADVAAIQRRLQALKYAPSQASWADGVYGPPTAAAVSKWQHAHVPGTTLFGQVWHDDWNHLFTY